MEVHHHSHTARKKWTHYFWEFSMLFLAVFCGFFAEYQLEHKIEKERGKQYILSFYADLISDTATLETSIKDYETKLSVIKNSRKCYDSLSIKGYPGDCMLELFNSSDGFIDLVTADQTLQQLKNAGGFRLLSKEDADSILSYDQQIRLYIKAETTGFQQKQYEIRQLMEQLLNYGSDVEDRTSIKIFIDDKKIVNRYFNSLFNYEAFCSFQCDFQKRLKQKASGMIEYFKTKYHLK